MIVIRNASARRILRVILPFVLIPAIVALGVFAVESQYHALVSFLVAVCSLVLFFCGFEKKKIGSRRLVIVAVMIGNILPTTENAIITATITNLRLPIFFFSKPQKNKSNEQTATKNETNA